MSVLAAALEAWKAQDVTERGWRMEEWRSKKVERYMSHAHVSLTCVCVPVHATATPQSKQGSIVVSVQIKTSHCFDFSLRLPSVKKIRKLTCP